MDTPSPTTTEVSLVPARRSRAGASDSDGGGVDEVSPALPASVGLVVLDPLILVSVL